MTFPIGAKVYKAHFGRHEKLVMCPDCLGTTHVKVVLGDGTEITIECGGCDPGGFRPSTGTIRQYDWSAYAKLHTVTGVKVTANSVEYDLDNFGTGSYFTGTSENVFATEAEAIAKGNEEKGEREAEENKRLMAKTKDAHSWAWNATYHRRCIKDLEKQLEYHRSKVQICEAKAKPEKVPA